MRTHNKFFHGEIKKIFELFESSFSKQKAFIFLLFLNKNICCGYSLEVSC